ncbi:MAG: superoxide dismutase [Sphingomonadaceae bacterium]
MSAPFKLDPLPFAYDALEPVLTTEAMELHHGKHHQAYVDNLNKAVAGTEFEGKSLEELFAQASKLPAAIRNNGGGHWNHRFFWDLHTTPGNNSQPSAALKTALDSTFGSVDNFKAEFEKAGVGQFGSGWAWLVKKADGSLVITGLPNQENPLMDTSPVQGKPILVNDVWEHAYYLTYRNRRPEYLSKWWQVLNWNKVNELFEG